MNDKPPSATIEAAELAGRIAAGDRSAEERLAAKYQRGIRFLLLRKTHGDLQLAEDLCQETLITVIRRLRDKPLDEPEKLAAFIHGVAKRLFASDLRKTMRRGTDADSEAVERALATNCDQVETLSRQECQEMVRNLIDEMSVPRDRELLVRAYVLDQDKAAVCQALQLDERHYDRVIYRARQRLRQLAEKRPI